MQLLGILSVFLFVLLVACANEKPTAPARPTPDIPGLVADVMTQMAPAATLVREPTQAAEPEPTVTSGPTPTNMPSATTIPTATTLPTPFDVPHLPTSIIMTDYIPISPKVKWMDIPSINANGLLTVHAKIIGDEKFIHPLRYEGDLESTTYSNLTIVDNVQPNHILIAAVMPQMHSDYYWTPSNTTVIADSYQITDKTLEIRVNINPDLEAISKLAVCVWTGGTKGTNEILDCTEVRTSR